MSKRRMDLHVDKIEKRLARLKQADPIAYEIAYALTEDFFKVQSGQWKTMDGGPGEIMINRASASLRARVIPLYQQIIRIVATPVERNPQPSSRARGARSGKAHRRGRR